MEVASQGVVDSLRGSGLLSADQLQIGLLEVRKTGNPLERVLLDLGFVSESVLRDARSENDGREAVELAAALPDPVALERVPVDLARRLRLLPLSYQADESLLLIAMVDAHDLQALDKLRTHIGSDITLKVALAGEREVMEAIDRFYGFELSIDGILAEIETGEIDESTIVLGQSEHSQPLVRLVEAILSDAVRKSVSDIHFEPEAGFIRIRYRIDGVMRQVRSFHIDHWSAIAVRLKVLAELNIAETRAPQDGRMSFSIAGARIEFRVSVLPTIHGENIVLRILDRKKGIVAMNALGLSPSVADALNLMMARPEGLILVTGPTGSGKTTTLYSMLNRISDERINIMTMEDPVEYPLPMLRQTTVNNQVKLDFAAGIRAILRQDPDVILVGEIRDEETAEMAFRASMTGHQVYSTLHANTAVGALARLSDMGVSRAVIFGNVIGIVGQRLVRKLCNNCKRAVVPEEVEQQIIGQCEQIYQASSCTECHHQGYRGRIALMEVLRFTPELEEMVLDGSSPAAILRIARKTGFQSLADDAVRRVLDGCTSLEEVSRVIDFTNRVL